MNNVTKNIVLWIVVLMVLLSVFNTVVHNSERSSEVSYTDFYDKLNDGQVQSVVVDDKTGVHKVITAQLMNGEKITVNAPKDDKLIDDLIKKNVDATYLPFQEESVFFRLLETILLTTKLAEWFPAI